MSLITKKWHICCMVKKIFYKLYYKEKIKLDKNVSFRNSFFVYIEDNAKLSIGSNTFFNNNCSISVMGKVNIGSNCLFGENVKIYDHNHKFRQADEPVARQGFTVGSVYVGDNSWIGTNVVLLKNANIGKHCVIGAGEVVSSTIPDNCMLKKSVIIKIENGNKKV